MDKYDFFAWYVKCIQEKFIAGYREKPAMENAYFGSLTGELLEFLDENRSLVQHITQSSAYLTLIQIVEDAIYQDVYHMIRSHGGNNLMMNPEDCTSFFTGGTVHLVLSKINVSLSKEDREDVIRAVCQMAQLMNLEDSTN